MDIKLPAAPVAAALFLKTPSLSPVKSRLAAGSSAEFACAWYLLAARAVIETVRACGIPCYLALSEHELVSVDKNLSAVALSRDLSNAVRDPDSITPSVWDEVEAPRLWQGSDPDLGAKMHCVLEQLLKRHGAGILLGADLPHLREDQLRPVVEQLQLAEDRLSAVQLLGPAYDGGFWCYASNRLPSREAMCAVRYSEADTAQQYRAALHAVAPWQFVETLRDVDQMDDLPACAEALAENLSANAAQRALLHWMQCQT